MPAPKPYCFVCTMRATKNHLDLAVKTLRASFSLSACNSNSPLHLLLRTGEITGKPSSIFAPTWISFMKPLSHRNPIFTAESDLQPAENKENHRRFLNLTLTVAKFVGVAADQFLLPKPTTSVASNLNPSKFFLVHQKPPSDCRSCQR
ncbi:hypothetical protein U1Q18_050379, partial [Sarracenia purpurea var. burkii]